MPSSPVLIFKIECTISLKLSNYYNKSTTRICREKKGVYNTAQELYFSPYMFALPQQATEPLSNRAQTLYPPALIATAGLLSGIGDVRIGSPVFASPPLPREYS